MTCKEYAALSQPEKLKMIGSVVHAIQSHSEIFKMGLRLIDQGEKLGLFDRVVINPEGKPPEPENPIFQRFVG